jgi:hypothetical protein
MCPITHASYLAIAVSVVASFIFGFLWFGPLFGKTWASLMGIKMEEGKCCKPPISSLLLTILGTLLTTFVMAYILNSSKGVCGCSCSMAALVWLGFYVPLLFGSVTWEGRPWKLFALNALYYFLNLQLIAAILTYVK